MGRMENVAIFEDTIRLCAENARLAETVRQSTAGQKLILEEDQLQEVSLDRYDKPARIWISQKKSLEAAAAYRDKKVAVLNFASASNPGGGVTRGASAQEECLCRCSSLYLNLNTQSMKEGFYYPHRQRQDPLHNDDIIYTPGVLVFKSDTSYPRLLPEEEWYEVGVITCAAPNLRSLPSNVSHEGDRGKSARISDMDLLRLHEKRLRRILQVAILEGRDSLILGAFGCGAFANNPGVVATAAANVLPDYLYAFQTIEYAIYCSPRDASNYRIFRQTLKPITG